MKLLLAFIAFLFAGAGSIYDFDAEAIDGSTIHFNQYHGRSLLIVNVASKCGNTPQYRELQMLHEKYGDRVTILGFPANNFANQEPGSNDDIASFCKLNYGVTFQLFEKISVLGVDQHPIYRWLNEKAGSEPSWNFCKYLVKPDGSVQFFSSDVQPMDQRILSQL